MLYKRYLINAKLLLFKYYSNHLICIYVQAHLYPVKYIPFDLIFPLSSKLDFCCHSNVIHKIMSFHSFKLLPVLFLILNKLFSDKCHSS